LRSSAASPRKGSHLVQREHAAAGGREHCIHARLSHKSPSDPVCRSVVGRPMFQAATYRKQWDETFTSAAKRDTSPTAQVPKLFGSIYATASMECRSDDSPVNVGVQAARSRSRRAAHGTLLC
jgi:hypothetical protein